MSHVEVTDVARTFVSVRRKRVETSLDPAGRSARATSGERRLPLPPPRSLIFFAPLRSTSRLGEKCLKPLLDHVAAGVIESVQPFGFRRRPQPQFRIPNSICQQASGMNNAVFFSIETGFRMVVLAMA